MTDTKIIDVLTGRVWSDYGWRDELRFIYTLDFLEDSKEYILEYFTIEKYKREQYQYHRIVFDYTLQKEKMIYNGSIVGENHFGEWVSFILEALMRKKFNRQMNGSTCLTHGDEEVREAVKHFIS